MVVYLGEPQVLVGQDLESLKRFLDAKGPGLHLFQDGLNSLRFDSDTPARDGSEDYIIGADKNLGCYTPVESIARPRVEVDMAQNGDWGGLDIAQREMMEDLASRIKDRRVLDVFARTPREAFVPLVPREFVYKDHPLPIGFEQTISQPYIVALMLQALSLKGSETVLEIGTGSGYQTALLAQLSARVVSVERVPELARDARQRLEQLGFTNVRVESVETQLGYPELAPYHAIVVSAAAPRVPDALMEQLAIGGKMVLPVGSREEQDLKLIEKRKRGKPKVKTLALCRFVPLIGDGAWKT